MPPKPKGFRTDRFTQKVKQIMQTHGDKKIIGAALARTPILPLWRSLFNILTFGEFQRRLEETPYDQLFHLRIDVQLDDYTIIGIEKLDIINMDVNPPIYDTTETKVITKLPRGLTINSLIENTSKFMGPKFYTYSAMKNNCQDFVRAILVSNNIGDEEDIAFVKQDLKSIFKDMNFLRKFANTATDLSAYIKMLLDNVPFTRNERIELLQLQEKSKPKYIIGGAMVSEIELEAKIRGILKGILQNNKGTLKGKVVANVKRKFPKKARLEKGSKEALDWGEMMAELRKKKREEAMGVIMEVPDEKTTDKKTTDKKTTDKKTTAKKTTAKKTTAKKTTKKTSSTKPKKKRSDEETPEGLEWLRGVLKQA